MPQHKVSSMIHTTHLTKYKIHFTTKKAHFNIHKIHFTTHKTHFIPPQNNFTTTHPSPQNYSQPSSLGLAVEDHLQKSIEYQERTREFLERQEQSWKEQEILYKKMDGHLEQMRKHLRLPSIQDEDQSVNEEVEEEAPVSSKISIKNEVVEVCEPRILYPQRLCELTEEHEDSLPKDLVEYHVEEREEVNQGNSY
ncbi:hypothetical protein AHAS_Ahas13G0289500 [Arachis hypogaea]